MNRQSKPQGAQLKEKNVSPARSRFCWLRSQDELKLVPVSRRQRPVKQAG